MTLGLEGECLCRNQLACQQVARTATRTCHAIDLRRVAANDAEPSESLRRDPAPSPSRVGPAVLSTATISALLVHQDVVDRLALGIGPLVSRSTSTSAGVWRGSRGRRFTTKAFAQFRITNRKEKATGEPAHLAGSGVAIFVFTRGYFKMFACQNALCWRQR